jgi:subtilisin family serine protease
MSRLYHNYLWGAVLFLFLSLAFVPAPTTAQTPTQTFRVIVGIDAPFRAEGELAGGNAVLFQRASIAARQQLVINALNNIGTPITNLKVYETIPYLAMAVDAGGLLALQLNPYVTGVAEDRLTRVSTSSANTVVNAPAAWSAGYTGTGYAVAILDTGVDFTHPALSSKNLNGGAAEACFTTNFAPQFAISACPNGQETQTGPGTSAPKLPPQCNDGCDHGTHVAGIAGGVGSSGGYSGGVAPGAMLIGVNIFTLFNDPDFCDGAQFTPCTASYDSDQLRGLEHVYSLRQIYNIASVNMSLGGGSYSGSCDGAASLGYLNAVANLRAARIAVIAASGNNGFTSSMGAPACLTNVISVGATTDGTTVASFSNSSNVLDLLAPGVAITSPVPGGSYESWNGTSMATPYVAGAWAIMRQAFPTESVTQILTRLKNAGQLITDTRTGAGNRQTRRINIGNSLPAPGVITFNAPSSSQSEGQVLNIPINLNVGAGATPLPSPFTVSITYNGPATRGTDYTAPNSVTFTRSGGWSTGNYPSEAILQIVMLNDDVVDVGETIVISLNPPMTGGVTVGSIYSSHTATIINTNIQATGTVNFATSTQTVGEYGVSGLTNNILVPVTMTVINGTPNIPGPFAVNLGYTNTGGAVRNTDYTAPNTVTFSETSYGQGTYTAYVPITILPRVGVQLPRYFSITLSSPSSGFVSVGGTQPSMNVVIVDGNQLLISENELRHEIMTLLSPSNQIDSVLPDFIAGSGINMVVILKDGTVGTVSITMPTQNGVHRVVLGDILVDGLPAPEHFVSVINDELPELILDGINAYMVKRTGASRRLEITSVNESTLTLNYRP